jgi:hypothetical protein
MRDWIRDKMPKKDKDDWKELERIVAGTEQNRTRMKIFAGKIKNIRSNLRKA